MAARRYILTLIVVLGLIANLVPLPTLARPVSDHAPARLLAPNICGSPSNEIEAENCLPGNPLPSGI